MLQFVIYKSLTSRYLAFLYQLSYPVPAHQDYHCLNPVLNASDTKISSIVIWYQWSRTVMIRYQWPRTVMIQYHLLRTIMIRYQYGRAYYTKLSSRSHLSQLVDVYLLYQGYDKNSLLIASSSCTSCHEYEAKDVTE
jgi:hypothetical protein